jgi:hypothetical protein
VGLGVSLRGCLLLPYPRFSLSQVFRTISGYLFECLRILGGSIVVGAIVNMGSVVGWKKGLLFTGSVSQSRLRRSEEGIV